MPPTASSSATPWRPGSRGDRSASVLEDDPEVTLDKAALDEAFDLWRSLRHIDRVFAALAEVATPAQLEDRRQAR